MSCNAVGVTQVVQIPFAPEVEAGVSQRIDFYDDQEAPAANRLVPSVIGEVRQEFSIVLTARPLSGQPTPSSESSEVRWVTVSEVPRYTMDRSMRLRINDYLDRKEAPVIV